jgi:hypothetical protein
MLRLDDEHVAAAPFRDHLVLQVLRGVLPAQVRLERRPQARALLSQPLADVLQLVAGRVEHVAGRIDLLADLAGLALERSGAARGRLEVRKRSRGAADGRTRFVHGIDERRERQETRRLERPSFDRERREDLRQIARGAKGKGAVGGEIARRFAGGREQPRDVLRIGGWTEPPQALDAHWRQREGCDGIDNPIEFEGPQGARMHHGNGIRAGWRNPIL